MNKNVLKQNLPFVIFFTLAIAMFIADDNLLYGAIASCLMSFYIIFRLVNPVKSVRVLLVSRNGIVEKNIERD